MTITKETLDAVIDQLKKNFKELAIFGLAFWVYRQDVKINEKDARITVLEKDNQEERRKHMSFVEYWNGRLQQAIDTADARLYRRKP